VKGSNLAQVALTIKMQN